MRVVLAILGSALAACTDPGANIHGNIRLTTPACGANPGDVVGYDLVIAPAAATAARSTTTPPSPGLRVSIACLDAGATPFDIDLDHAGTYGVTLTPFLWTSAQPNDGLVPQACIPMQLAPRTIEGAVDYQTVDVAAVIDRG